MNYIHHAIYNNEVYIYMEIRCSILEIKFILPTATSYGLFPKLKNLNSKFLA